MVLNLLACSQSDDVEGPLNLIDLDLSQQTAKLTSFSSCDVLEQYIQRTTYEELNHSLDQQMLWYDYTTDNSADDFDSAPGADAPDSGAGEPGGSESDRPDAYSDTNTQVEGVDEPDFVKTDGVYTYVITGETLYRTKTWPPEDLAVQGSVPIEGWPLELFLDQENDRLVVLSSIQSSDFINGGPDIDVAFDSEPCGPGPWGCGGYSENTKVTLIDITDEGLEVVQNMDIAGRYTSARRIGDIVRLVMNQSIQKPDNIRDWIENYEYNQGPEHPRNQRALKETKEHNQQVIAAHPLKDWFLPGVFPEEGSDEEKEIFCQNIYRPATPQPLAIVSVATFDVSSLPSDVQLTSVLARGHTVYASQSGLYVAYTDWNWLAENEEGSLVTTSVHKFDISSASETTYIGSGRVDGRLLNQFSMDEYDGYLRMALTREDIEGASGDFWGSFRLSNDVVVLGENEGTLEVVGQIKDLAPNEQITSARFLGPRGFVVTFERVDPLFTLDLSEPTDPKLVGELKIPGFSTYLHPLDENHLLAIGEDIPEPDDNGRIDWSERGLKLSVFDVSDMASPQEKYVHSFGGVSSYSDALNDHRAFNWFPTQQTLAIPFYDFGEYSDDGRQSEFSTRVHLFNVSIEDGITDAGALYMQDMYTSNEWNEYYYSPLVRRSLMADEYVYGISDAGIRVAKISDPSTPVASVLFSETTGQ